MGPKSPKGPSLKEKKKLAKIHEAKVKESYEHIETGMGFMEKGKYVQAIPLFAQAIDVYPENSEAFLQRGRANKELKEYAEAISDLTRALELDPEDAEAYASRGNAYECIQDYDKAIDDYTSVIERLPDDDHAYNMRGNARQARRIPGLKLKNAEFAAVISDFTKAIELNPDNYYAFNNRGNAYFDRKDFRNAIEDYSNAIRVKADYAYSFLRRGIASYEAVLFAEKLASQGPNEDDCADEDDGGKEAKVAKDGTDHAAQWEQEFKEEEEKERRAQERTQLLESALADFKTVLTFDNSDIEAYTHRAKVYEMLGLIEEAKADQSKTLELEVKAAQNAAHR